VARAHDLRTLLCLSVCLSACAAPSPRLERCLSAAKASGASEEWLQEKYTSIRKGSTLGHQTFRILCCAGPGEGRLRTLLLRMLAMIFDVYLALAGVA
jgi:hypothetical protein